MSTSEKVSVSQKQILFMWCGSPYFLISGADGWVRTNDIPPGAVLYRLSYVCVCALPAFQQEPIRCIGAVSYGRGLY